MKPLHRGLILLTLGLAAALVMAVPVSARTVWLCKPGQRPDPCTPGLSTTLYTPSRQLIKVVHPKRAEDPVFDCFYVYPTVSDQPTTLANRHIDPEERSVALYQAARYSQYCRVFAPMYRQITVKGLTSGTTLSPAQLAEPLEDVRAAFATYLRRDNHGRPFVLIGHSQGSGVLKELIADDVDAHPAVRSRLLSAILLGGNVLVKEGSGVGGSFQHVPACRSAVQLGCVIAFSTFDQPPPSTSLFGRTLVKGQQVLCTNPAALSGDRGRVDPIFPSVPFARGTSDTDVTNQLGITQPHPSTVWISEPGAYQARCTSSGGADVLEISPLGGAQTPTPSPSPSWGLHLLDANVALGNLLTIVHSEATAYVSQHDMPTPPSPGTGVRFDSHP